VNKNNSPERIDPVDLIGTNYEAVEMSDVCRLDIQNRTRAVVAARHKMPAIRWAISLAGAAALIVVLALSLHRLPVSPTGKGHGQAQFGSTPPHMVQHHATASQSGSSHVKMAPKKTAPNVNRMAIKPTVKKNAPRAIPVVAPQLGEPMVVVVSVQQPVKNGVGKILSVGDRVASGDTIRTGKGGRVTLVTRKGSELNLDSNSSLVLTTSTVATILRGRLYCSNRDKEIARIDTPAGHVKLLGTVVDTNIVRQDTVAVTVVEGKVQLSNRHGNALVSAGKRSMLVAFRPPQAGAAVDTYKETAWYHGRGDFESDFGEVAFGVQRQTSTGILTEIWTSKEDGTDKHRVRTFIGYPLELGPWVPGERWLSLDLWGASCRTSDPKKKTGYSGNMISGGSLVDRRTLLVDAATGQSVLLDFPEGFFALRNSFAPNPRLMAICGRYTPDPNNPMIEEGVWVYDRRSGRLTRVYNGPCGSPVAWAPDSRHTAISAGESSTNERELLILDTLTGKTRDLGVQGDGASFSPDGTEVAYCGEFKNEGKGSGAWFRGVPMSGNIFVLDLVTPGSKPVRISAEKNGAVEPRWSPDGSRIVYIVYMPPTGDGHSLVSVCVVNADGTGLKEIYRNENTWIEKASWNPAGDTVFVTEDFHRTTRLVAADGSGVRRTLSQADGELPPDARQQTDAAAAAIKEALFQYAMGKTLLFDGDVTAREHFATAADILGGLLWNYPLSGLGADDICRYADVAQKEASRSDADILSDSCEQRTGFLRMVVSRVTAEHRQFPPDLQTGLTWSLSGTWQLGWLGPKDVTHMMMLGTCPGDVRHGATPYIYTPPAPGVEPKAGTVIVRCALHPDECVRWDQNMASQINRTLLKEAAPGAWCCLGDDANLFGSDGHVEFNLGIPYRFENAGDGPVTVIYHMLTDTYEIKGKAKLLPLARIYSDETMQVGALDEARVARAIDAAGKLDWGSLPKEEIERAQGELDFCRGVAQMEAGQPITACKVIDGEPARLLTVGVPGKWYRSFGTDLYFNQVGSDKVEIYQLNPSGRFRVYGSVKVKGTVCKNGWVDKDGKVISTD